MIASGAQAEKSIAPKAVPILAQDRPLGNGKDMNFFLKVRRFPGFGGFQGGSNGKETRTKGRLPPEAAALETAKNLSNPATLSGLLDTSCAILVSSNKRRPIAMQVKVRYVRGHVEVYDQFGAFLFSADSIGEALAELEEDAA